MVKTFRAMVRVEIDLRLEAAAAAELAENFAGDTTYRVPQVDWRRTTRRALTLERLTGIRMDDRAGMLAAGIDIDLALARAAAIFFKQAFRDGFFHGDQHPGNMFVDLEGNIGAVDFGIMGRLDRKTRYYLADMLLGFLERDYRRVAEVQFARGIRAGGPVDGGIHPGLPLDRRADLRPLPGRDLLRPGAGPAPAALRNPSRWRPSPSSCCCRRTC